MEGQKIVDHWNFRDLFTNGMIKYNQTHVKYLSDVNMRTATHKKNLQERRASKLLGKKMEAVNRGGSIVQLWKKPKEAKYRRGATSHLCGNLTKLGMNLKSAETGNKNGKTSKVCGKVSYSKCSICGVYLNLMPNRGQAVGRTWFFDYHNDAFFGLARADAGL